MYSIIRELELNWKKIITIAIASNVIVGLILGLFQLYKINRDFLIIKVIESTTTKFIVLDEKRLEKRYKAHRQIYIDEKTGMLIEYPEQEVQQFQQYSLYNKIRERDYIFVNDERKIVSIHKSTEIDFNKPISSKFPASMRIELFAGQVNKLGLKVGMPIDIMHSLTGFTY